MYDKQKDRQEDRQTGRSCRAELTYGVAETASKLTATAFACEVISASNQHTEVEKILNSTRRNVSHDSSLVGSLSKVQDDVKQRNSFHFSPFTSHLLAFTLAEVLITLLVVGVVATLTISPIMKKINEHEFAAKYKKSFSTLSTAFRNAAIDNGGTIKGICADTQHNCLKDLIKPYLNVAKECSTGTVFGNCWTSCKVPYNCAGWFTNNSGLILNDGTLIYFNQGDCNTWTQPGFAAHPVCGFLEIDTNGFKPPNLLGQDVWEIWVGHKDIYADMQRQEAFNILMK